MHGYEYKTVKGYIIGMKIQKNMTTGLVNE